MSPELEYRLSLVRVLDRVVRETEKEQAHLATSAWRKAMTWGHELLIEGARESISVLGPMGLLAKDREVEDFKASIARASMQGAEEADVPGQAA